MKRSRAVVGVYVSGMVASDMVAYGYRPVGRCRVRCHTARGGV